MKYQTNCPKCKSNKVRLIDVESIFLTENEPDDNANENEFYQWDEEIYATAKCDGCGHTYSIEGKITWNV